MWPHGTRHLHQLLPPFSGAFTSNQIGSRPTRTQIGTHMLCWLCRQQLHLLGHNASPELIFLKLLTYLHETQINRILIHWFTPWYLTQLSQEPSTQSSLLTGIAVTQSLCPHCYLPELPEQEAGLRSQRRVLSPGTLMEGVSIFTGALTTGPNTSPTTMVRTN